MKSRSFLIFSLFVFTLSSCTKKPIFSSQLPASDIKDMVIFEPISYISLINKGDKLEFSDSLSRVSQKLWLTVVEQNRYRLPMDKISVLENDFERMQLREETRALFEEIETLDKFHSIPIPPTLKSQLELSGHRFGMLSVTSGFTRRKGNLTGQMFKSIGIGIITMGMVVPVPMTAHSNVYVLIMDNEQDEVIYYRSSKMSDSQPLKVKTLHRQLDSLYKDYLW
jgi:hypothetical protein